MDIHFILSLFHLAFVAPLFFYVFVQRAATPEWLYHLLFFLGLFVLVYHAMKSVLKYMSKSSSIWVNVIHVLLVAPLLIYIGYHSKKTPRPAYEMMGMAAFAVSGYHIYSIIVSLNTKKDE